MIPAAGFQFAFIAGVGVLKTVASALVVARFEASELAWLFLVAALVTAVGAAVDGAMRRSAAPPRHSLLVASGVTLALGLGAALGSRHAVAGLFVFGEAYATVTSVRFWASLGETFDPRESKRLFGVIGGFGMAGMILGGLLGGLGPVVGALPLLGFAVLSMLVCATISGTLRRRAQRPAPRSLSSLEIPVAAAGGRERLWRIHDLFRAFLAQRYLRLLGAFAALAAMLTVLSDFLFRVSAQGTDEGTLAALFGGSTLVLGVSAMLFQLLLAGRMLTRFGVFRYLALVPAGAAAVGLACALRPGLWPAFLLRVVESMGSLSLQPTGMQLLYAPLPDDTRLGARALVDGLVKKGGAAVGGLVLVAAAPRGGSVGLALAVVATALAVLGVLTLLRRAYVEQIEARLSRPRWGEPVALDAEARGLLLERLSERDPARVLMAADLLAAHRATPASPWVRMLLAHPSERVRHRGVNLAAEFGLTEVVPKLRSLVGSDVRRPRDEAVVALARLDPDARGFLSPLLGSSDPGLRGAAIAALMPVELREGAGGPAAAALDALVQEQAPTEGERRELARLLGRLPGTRWVPELDRLVDDPDPGVRRLAIAAAGECRRLQLVPRLLELLGERAYRTEARRALAAMGEPVVEVVADALGDRSRPASLRWELPRLLRYIGTPRAAQALLDGHDGGDPFLRYRIALALSHLRRHHEELQFDRERVLEAVSRRVGAYGYYLPIYRDLQRALGDGAIVVRALRGRLDQGGEMVFRLLGLVYPLRSMMNVFNRFAGGEARERAYALELFENLVDEDVRDRIVPLAERWHRLPSTDGSPERAPERLQELAGSKDPVLRACARYAAGHAGGAATGRIEEDAVSDSVVQKVFLLEGVRIFEKCSVDDLTALASIAEERRFPAGTVIYRENDPGDALFVLVEGHVLAEKEGRTILEVHEKEAFGDVSLLDGEPRPASARALEDSRALVIDRQDFLDLLSDRPELLKGLFAVLTRQMRQVLELAAPQRGGGGS